MLLLWLTAAALAFKSVEVLLLSIVPGVTADTMPMDPPALVSCQMRPDVWETAVQLDGPAAGPSPTICVEVTERPAARDAGLFRSR